MSLEDAVKNTIVMSMVIAVSHLLVKSMIDGGEPSRETFVERGKEDVCDSRPSLRQQKREELLKFVLEEPAPETETALPQTDNYLKSRDESFCNIKRQQTESVGILAFNDFTSDFSAVNFSS